MVSVSYFVSSTEANGRHKCDLNNATYEHDNELSGDLAKNENYVYRGAEVSIKLVKVFNLPTRLCLLFLFCEDYFWPGFTNCEHLRAAPRKYRLNLEIAKKSNFSKLDQNEALRALITKILF